MRRLLVSSIGVVGLRAAGVLLQLAALLYLARVLAPKHMGVFVVVYACLGLVRFLGPLGTDQLMLRRFAVGELDNNRGEDAVRSAVLCAGFSGVSVGVSLAAFLMFNSGLTWCGVAAISISAPLFSFMGLFSGVLRGIGRNIASQLPESLVLHLIFGALVVMIPRGLLDLDAALLSVMCAALLANLAYLGFFRGTNLRLIGRNSGEGVISCAQEAFPIFRALLFTSLAVRAPLFLTAGLLGPVAAAVVEMGLRFGTAASLTTGSVGATFSAHLALQYKEHNVEKLWRTVAIGCVSSSAPAIAWLIFLIVVMPHFIGSILPVEYSESLQVMKIIAAAYVVNATFGLSTNLLFMTGRSKATEVLALVQLGILVFGAVLALPIFGVEAIAWSVLFAAVVRDGGAMAYAWNVMRPGRATVAS